MSPETGSSPDHPAVRPDPTGEFLEIVRILRRDCAWKAGQTHRTLRRHLLEETYETLDAIDSGDAGHLCEELGDLLLQVVFHAVIAEEGSGQGGSFTFDDVVAGVTEKMIRRNPHVFGPERRPLRGVDGTVAGPAGPDAAAVNDTWEAIKAAERRDRGQPGQEPVAALLDGLPAALPALMYADKVLDRLARAEASEMHGEASEMHGVSAAADAVGSPEDLGDLLLDMVGLARLHGWDAEHALRDAVRRRLSPVSRT
ncbi:MAG: MazG nucleotide pyrophosphohydrolase domain-containing protein [Nocardioides sp.]